ncbi:MAG TPA: flavin reductase family protein [Pseudonocardiaceae bacterium]
MITEEILRQHRNAVRQLASGVAVLTVADERGTHGATVSALAAVSRDPLLVGACLNRNSLFLRRVRARRWFSVSALNTEQTLLARWFADPGRPRDSSQFDGIAARVDPISGAPLLEGALAHLTCRVSYCLAAGDHFLLIADVADGTRGRGTPLLSFAGTLHDGPAGMPPTDPYLAAPVLTEGTG